MEASCCLLMTSSLSISQPNKAASDERARKSPTAQPKSSWCLRRIAKRCPTFPGDVPVPDAPILSTGKEGDKVKEGVED